MSDTLTTFQPNSDRLVVPHLPVSAVEIHDASASGRNGDDWLVNIGALGSHTSKRQPKTNRRTIRRLRGFLIAYEGGEARVGFVDGKTVTEYCLPEKYLRASKIIERGQPFEMDEFEEISPHGFTSGTEFRPIAAVGTGKTSTATLSAEQTELRNAILAYPPFEHKV